MSLNPDDPKIEINQEKENFLELSTLEDIFELGYANSKKIDIYNDGKVKISATFRTLTHNEVKDVFEQSNKYTTLAAQTMAERVETLARAIKTINDMPLHLSTLEREEFRKEYNRDPTPVEQAKVTLVKKIKSHLVIDALYEAYIEFSSKIEKEFVDIKKKLKNQTS